MRCDLFNQSSTCVLWLFGIYCVTTTDPIEPGQNLMVMGSFAYTFFNVFLCGSYIRYLRLGAECAINAIMCGWVMAGMRFGLRNAFEDSTVYIEILATYLRAIC